ncbi:unnamed protein product [Chrysoparadoxa australica]
MQPAPYTGRKRFLVVPEKQMRHMGNVMFQQVKAQNQYKLLPQAHPATQTVKRVGQKVARASGKLGKGYEWDFAVIREDDTMNAFVLPGGKVCVYTGLFKVCPSETALAAVLGHEAGHALANHAGEKLSKAWFAEWIVMLLCTLGIGDYTLMTWFQKLCLDLPNSRELETEADKIGLELMARACYDPREMPKVFSRMAAAHNSIARESKIAGYLSTHPSDKTRIEQQKEWLSEALALYDSKCGGVQQAFQESVHETRIPVKAI